MDRTPNNTGSQKRSNVGSNATTLRKKAKTLTKSPSRNRCSICWKKDGEFDEMRLVTCATCGVVVHHSCYGLATPSEDEEGDAETEQRDWHCWACLAVGQEFSACNVLTREIVDNVKVDKRPNDCCLCGYVSPEPDYPLPMYPIYDNHGPKGRQLLLPTKLTTKDKIEDPSTYKLAWAHTLCISAINLNHATKGSIYGVDRQGNFDGYRVASKLSSEQYEKIPDNPETKKETVLHEDVHHYVYSLPRKPFVKTDTNLDLFEGRQPANDYVKIIREHQNELSCEICGLKDNIRSPKHPDQFSLRIPLQCYANDPYEFQEFRNTHPDLGSATCYQPSHVGCAMYGSSENREFPSVRRVFFFPGRNTDGDCYNDPITCLYCQLHAEDVVRAGRAGKKVSFH